MELPIGGEPASVPQGFGGDETVIFIGHTHIEKIETERRLQRKKKKTGRG